MISDDIRGRVATGINKNKDPLAPWLFILSMEEPLATLELLLRPPAHYSKSRLLMLLLKKAKADDKLTISQEKNK